MAGFLETLTVRIVGESSSLQREIAGAKAGLEGLTREATRLSQMGASLAQPFERLGASQRSLSGLTNSLSRVAGQVQQLSGSSITLNVSPALRALANLSAAIAQVQARLSGLAGASVAGVANGLAGAASGAGAGAGTRAGTLINASSLLATGSAVSAFAAGGLVVGPGGVDRVPAMLTSGEFVLRPEAVDRVGVDRIMELNTGIGLRAWGLGIGQREQRASVTTSHMTTTHAYGDISIHVTGGAQVGDVVRDLAMQGFRVRQRRG